MRPVWHSTGAAIAASEASAEAFPAIPYEQMWQDDIHWMPLMLSKKPFVGRADFVQNPTKPGEYEMRKWWFGIPPAYAT